VHYQAHEPQIGQAFSASSASLLGLRDHDLSDSFADMVLLNEEFSDNSAKELIEKEVVDFNVGESSLEKLARMMAA